MINFALPGFYEHLNLNLKLLQLIENSPYCFYDNIKINAIYGNFPFCIFDGGRIFQNYKQCSLEEIEYIQKLYDNYNIPIRLIFTSSAIQPKHFTDRFCNMVMKTIENEKNEIVVNNLELEAYIREHYPKFKIISSTTKCLNTPENSLKELHKDYKYVCLDYNLNKEWDYLNNIPESLKSKVEFLVNAICPSNCSNRKEHYRLNSLQHLNFGKRYQMIGCAINNNTCHYSVIHSKNNLTYEDIINDYEPKGFINFKLEGRTLSDLELACNYVRYLCKPEWRLWVLTKLVPNEQI